ncbi:DUF4386 domain-containing protein [bacterium]|nr:DUF4386 domain-containing protein [bacterium]
MEEAGLRHLELVARNTQPTSVVQEETMMDQNPKAAGIAALTAAATFLFGIVMFATVLTDYTTGDPTPEESVAFVVDHQAALYVWNVVIFIIFGIVLVPLVLVLRDRLKELSPAIAQASGAFGLIWAGLVIAAGMISNIAIGTVSDLHDTDPAGAETVWSALDSVQNGLGGGNEIAGGVWILLVSWAALRTAVLPRALNYVGMAAGAAGLITVIPALEAVGAVFGIGLIVWFVWVGVLLLKEHAPDQR